MQRRPRPWRNGLTLIETLALIPTLVLAVAVTFPSLQRARSRSRNDVCVSRLKAIIGAARMYESGDPGDTMIPVHPVLGVPPGTHATQLQSLGANIWGGKSGIGNSGWVPYPGTLGSRWGTAAGVGPATRPMNAILYPSGFKDAFENGQFSRTRAAADTKLPLDAYRCPADDGPPGGAHCAEWVEGEGLSSFDHFGNSYAANNTLSAVAYSSLPELVSISPFFRSASRVPNPTRTIAYEENIGHFAWAARNEIPDCTWNGAGATLGPTKAVRGWHGKKWRFNNAFVDGRVDEVAVYIEGTEDAEGYAQHYRSEPAFDDPQLNASYKCVIIRGPGWQRDTLPAPEIGTGILRDYYGRSALEGCVRTD